MTNRFAGIFDAPDPGSCRPPAQNSVQSSLFQRLKRSHGKNSGAIGWMLVRLGQPSHHDHAAALDTIEDLGEKGRAGLLLTVRKTLGAPAIQARPECVELASAIVEALLPPHVMTEFEAAAMRKAIAARGAK